jgi:O-antigen/teichoic acid export membrane protein
MYAPAALGLYTRASGLQALPVGLISGVVQRVAFPLFSKHQDDKALLVSILRRQVRLIVLLASLVMALLAVTAADLIPWLFGAHWAGSVPLLQILAFAGVLAAVFPVLSQMTMAIGQSGIFFKVEILKKLVIVVVLAVVYRFGIEAFAWGAVAISVADYCLSAYPSVRFLGYSWRMQASDLVPACMLIGFSALVVLHIPWDPYWAAPALIVVKSLTLCGLAGVGLFAFRRSFLADAWSMLSALSRAAGTRLVRRASRTAP